MYRSIIERQDIRKEQAYLQEALLQPFAHTVCYLAFEGIAPHQQFYDD